MTDGIGAGEAARRLATSTPTVRSLIRRGLLQGTQRKRGSTFRWLVNESSLEAFLKQHGRIDGRRRVGESRREASSSDLSTDGLVEKVQIEKERDDLRAKVVALEEALARAHDVAELQRKADAERARVIDHLLAAASAGERADTLRRQAVSELEGALAAAAGPGHLGELR